MIDIEEMRPQLYTLDEVRAKLESTENLSQQEFSTDGSDDVAFTFPENWNVDLDSLHPTDITRASIEINGAERRLTKEAVLQATSQVGLAEKYVKDSPGELIAMNMDYWYNHGNKRLKMLAGNEAAVAFTRDTIVPFSNIRLLDQVVNTLRIKYHTDDILVDYKFDHDLKQTTTRLVVPSHYLSIGSSRAEAAQDSWSVGLELRNSVIGASSTQIHGYLFAWWCTNGATTTHLSSGKYRRRPTADQDEVYQWAGGVVEDVLNGLDAELVRVSELTQEPLDVENLSQSLGTMFDRFGVPTRAREAVLRNLADSDDMTAYGLLAAITAVGNDPSLSGPVVDRLLQAGGLMPHVLSGACDSCGRF